MSLFQIKFSASKLPEMLAKSFLPYYFPNFGNRLSISSPFVPKNNA